MSEITTHPPAEVRPALASVPTACHYLGGISRARLYELRPQLEWVKIGERSFITIRSLDDLIAANLTPPAVVTPPAAA